MGATKYEIYTDELINMANMLKAMAHPARLKALLIIANETDEDITAKDILKGINLSQSTISAHLKQLSDVGLVKTRIGIKNNKSCLCYRIHKPALEQVEKLLHHLFSKTDLKTDDSYQSLREFYSKLRMITNWNQCFDS
jgi:DNA-binding transcriptional ArsR family regulator